MKVRYVSQDLEWTDAMKALANMKLIAPLARAMGPHHFELSLHFSMERKRMLGRKPSYELWAVLQKYDGLGNEVIRRQGEVFGELIQEVSATLRARLRKERERAREIRGAFKVLTADESA